MINEHTVDYRPIHSKLTSRIQPLIFLWTFKGLSLQNISLIFSQTCISHSGCEKFQIYDVKITGEYICESKNWFCSFLIMPLSEGIPQVLIITHQAERKYPFLPVLPGDLFFHQQKGGRVMELKKWPILNLWGYWSQVLINSTIFATFTFLVSVLLSLI